LPQGGHGGMIRRAQDVAQDGSHFQKISIRVCDEARAQAVSAGERFLLAVRQNQDDAMPDQKLPQADKLLQVFFIFRMQDD